MAFDVTALGTYTQPNEKTMLVKAVLGAKTINLIKTKGGTIMTGVKTKSQLPKMETDAVFQDGKGCGFTPSGTTKISTRSIEVGNIKVQEALCPSDVEDSFEQANLTSGSDYTEIIFANDYVDQKSKKIALALEKLAWSGDKASADAQLKRADGYRELAKAASDTIDGNTGGVTVATGITKANVLAILDGVYEAFPEESIEAENAFIMVGSEVMRLYKAALKSANLFHYEPSTDPGEATLYGTNMKIYSTPGLNSTKEIYGSTWNNMVFATDLIEETERIELKYAPEAEEVRFSAKFKAGFQFAFTDEVVIFELV
ncbi:MAG: hypothetical protein ABIN67_13785 [Ferruginibacter sp.]